MLTPCLHGLSRHNLKQVSEGGYVIDKLRPKGVYQAYPRGTMWLP